MRLSACERVWWVHKYVCVCEREIVCVCPSALLFRHCSSDSQVSLQHRRLGASRRRPRTANSPPPSAPPPPVRFRPAVALAGACWSSFYSTRREERRTHGALIIILRNRRKERSDGNWCQIKSVFGSAVYSKIALRNRLILIETSNIAQYGFLYRIWFIIYCTWIQVSLIIFFVWFV